MLKVGDYTDEELLWIDEIRQLSEGQRKALRLVILRMKDPDAPGEAPPSMPVLSPSDRRLAP